MAGIEDVPTRALAERNNFDAAQRRIDNFCDMELDSFISPSELAVSLRGLSDAVGAAVRHQDTNTFPLTLLAPKDDLWLDARAYLHRVVARGPVDSGLLGKRLVVIPEKSAIHATGATVKVEIQKADILGATEWEDLTRVTLPTDRLIINELEDPAHLNEREGIAAWHKRKHITPFNTLDVREGADTPTQYFSVLQSLIRVLRDHVDMSTSKSDLPKTPYL